MCGKMVIDPVCAVLLYVALYSGNIDERMLAIDKLGELGCNFELCIIAVIGQSNDERMRALKRIKKQN